MPNAEKQFSESELLEIETAVVQAEEKTSAEIVVAVASESGRYDRGECHFGIVVAILALILFNLVKYVLDEEKQSIFDAGLPFYWQMAIVLSGYVSGMIAASLNTKLRMVLCTPEEVEEEVEEDDFMAATIAAGVYNRFAASRQPKRSPTSAVTVSHDSAGAL